MAHEARISSGSSANSHKVRSTAVVKASKDAKYRCRLLTFFHRYSMGLKSGAVGWQLELGEALGMQGKELIHHSTGVILAPSRIRMMLLGLGQDLGQKVSIKAAGEALSLTLPEERPER